MNVWLVTREYAGIAEAGGVKNVSCSLSESLASLGHDVTAFMPIYKCTDLSSLESYEKGGDETVTIDACGGKHEVSFSRGFLNGVEIVLVHHQCFQEKQAVYTYTKEEEILNPEHKHGNGHCDVLFMNTLFQKSVIAYGKMMARKGKDKPDIIHCQDAATAMVPVFMDYEKNVCPDAEAYFAHTKCLVTIHNAGPGYHHEFHSLHEASFFTGLPGSTLAQGLNGQNVEPFLLAERCSCLTTVSPQYAEEILSEQTDTAGLSREYRLRGSKIVGITNGIDISRYTPTDVKSSLLPYPFNPESGDLKGKYLCRKDLLENYANEDSSSDLPKDIETYGYIEKAKKDEELVYIAYHGRVVWQKGITVLAKAADSILSKGSPVRFIFIGQGQPDLERELLQIALKHEGKCVYFRGYDRFLSRLCMASADLAIFPSYFEPCGLEDLIAQIFGTIPVAHATGGLCKIVDEETGFLYSNNTPEELTSLLDALIKIKMMVGSDVFDKMISHTACNVREKFTWNQVTQKRYVPLYESLLDGQKQN